jgi:hypothetical protein
MGPGGNGRSSKAGTVVGTGTEVNPTAADAGCIGKEAEVAPTWDVHASSVAVAHARDEAIDVLVPDESVAYEVVTRRGETIVRGEATTGVDRRSVSKEEAGDAPAPSESTSVG